VIAPRSVSLLAQRFDLYQRTLEEIQAVPGVENAGTIGDLFIANSRDQVVTVERGEGIVSQPVRLRRDEVSAGFFKATGTPLLRGRVFSNQDGPDASRVAIVNDAMTREAWPGSEAVGKRFELGPSVRGSRSAWPAWFSAWPVHGGSGESNRAWCSA
jgi:putative ABC transport system permease protein